MKKAVAVFLSVLFVFMLSAAASAEDVPANVIGLSEFGDAPGNAAVNFFYANGIVDGYPDGDFKPDEPITNAQLAKILTKTFHLESDREKGYKEYLDVTSGNWAYEYICAAGGYIDGGADEFAPDNTVTGEELADALRNLSQADIDESLARKENLSRGEVMNALYDALKDSRYEDSFKIPEDETIPQEYSIRYKNTYFSNRPMYFNAPKYGSYGGPDDFTGYVYASWDPGEQKAVFYAKVYVNDDCYEYTLRELKFCGIDDTMSTIAGKYDIFRNGEKVADSIDAKAYGFELEYFKFYSEGEQWHMSAYVTTRNIADN